MLPVEHHVLVVTQEIAQRDEALSEVEVRLAGDAVHGGVGRVAACAARATRRCGAGDRAVARGDRDAGAEPGNAIEPAPCALRPPVVKASAATNTTPPPAINQRI